MLEYYRDEREPMHARFRGMIVVTSEALEFVDVSG
jgi:hypothetical protein